MNKITVIEGDGIGPEITKATLEAARAAGAELDIEFMSAGANALKEEGELLPAKTLESIKKRGVALKGPVTTPIGKGFRSVNVALRKTLNLYAAVRPAKNIEGVKTHFEGVDIVTVRENTEDLYAGIEEMQDKDTARSIKLITRSASTRIARFAFDWALKNGRKKVSVITKANICKFSDGMFLDCARNIAKNYPQINFEELLVDNACMQLASAPQNFDVLLCPNLYGDIISDLTAGLTGGLGFAPGANYGDGFAVFEAVHGSAPTIAGTGKANPCAMMFSCVLMLRHLGQAAAADKMERGVLKTVKSGFLTADAGGSATCSEFTREVIKNM